MHDTIIKKIDATCDAVVSNDRIAQVTTVYQSEILVMNGFSVFVSGNGHNISIAMNSKGLWAGSSFQ